MVARQEHVLVAQSRMYQERDMVDAMLACHPKGIVRRRMLASAASACAWAARR
jgi:hypothetical protein